MFRSWPPPSWSTTRRRTTTRCAASGSTSPSPTATAAARCWTPTRSGPSSEGSRFSLPGRSKDAPPSRRGVQLHAPVELISLLLGELGPIGRCIGLPLALRHQHELALVAGLAQVTGHRLEPLARQLHIVGVGAAAV